MAKARQNLKKRFKQNPDQVSAERIAVLLANDPEKNALSRKKKNKARRERKASK